VIILTDAIPRGLGYLEIDQRPVEAALPPGTPRHFEAETYTCSHCQRVVILNSQRIRERYKCRGCQHHICDACAAMRATGGPCRTFAQIADETMERAARQSESSLIILP